MFKKSIVLISILFMIITGSPAYVYADEITVPTQPDITGKTPEEANEEINQYNSEVDAYNAEVDIYNNNVDSAYEAAVLNYETEVAEVTEHNNQEDAKVAEVEAHNQEEDEKLAESQAELAIIEEKVEADQPGSIVEDFTEDAEELPSDWSDESEELHTIVIEEAEEKSGEEVSIINLHLYLDSEYIPSEVISDIDDSMFTVSQEVKDSLLFAEWEIATFDLNDRVTVMSEGEAYKNGRIRHDGKNYKVQDYDSRFIRNVEDYTQGAWTGSSEAYSNSNTMEYGWGYDFDTQTGKGGETYTFEFNEEETTQSYLYNGEVQYETVTQRTVDGTAPKNILSVFVYIFQRFWAEPEEYVPNYQEYEPNYMEEPEAPVKGEYLEKLDHMDLIDIPEVPDTPTPDPEPTPEPTPTPTPTPKPVIPEVIIVPDDPTPEPEVEPVVEPEPIEVEPIEIDDDPTPQTDPVIGNWALFNLICSVLTAVVAVLKVIFFKRNEKEEDDNKEEVTIKNSYLVPVSSLVLTVCSFYLFFITEDTTLPMVMFDKFSPIMFIMLVIGSLILFAKAKKEEEQE